MSQVDLQKLRSTLIREQKTSPVYLDLKEVSFLLDNLNRMMMVDELYLVDSDHPCFQSSLERYQICFPLYLKLKEAS